jgi:predicted ABC-type ATPase
MSRPQLIIIAGPNGSGKSTIFPAIQNVKKDGFLLAPIKIKDENFINSDNIASKFSIGDLAAGRKTIEKIKELIGKDEDFAIETTFSGKTLSKYVELARRKGYNIYIIFMSLRSSELSMNRVSQRALLGKHYVSLKRILKRYDRSIKNFFTIYKDLSDFWVITDNSTLNPDVLYWGGHSFANPQNIFTKNLEKNYITKFMDLKYLSMDDSISPKFFDLVKTKILDEIKNRPKGNLVSIQDEDGQIKFVMPL